MSMKLIEKESVRVGNLFTIKNHQFLGRDKEVENIYMLLEPWVIFGA